jgi:hypothetical protein
MNLEHEKEEKNREFISDASEQKSVEFDCVFVKWTERKEAT